MVGIYWLLQKIPAWAVTLFVLFYIYGIIFILRKFVEQKHTFYWSPYLAFMPGDLLLFAFVYLSVLALQQEVVPAWLPQLLWQGFSFSSLFVVALFFLQQVT